MPMETKNNTENASRNGSKSEAMRWLNGDSLTTAPATNAPKASDTPNNSEAPKAMPSAIAKIAKINNSRDRVCATRNSSHGIKRLPANSINIKKPTAASKVIPTARQSGAAARVLLKLGITSKISTVAISSMTRQPTATRPCDVFNQPLSMKPRSITIVLAMETASPSIKPANGVQPQYQARP